MSRRLALLAQRAKQVDPPLRAGAALGELAGAISEGKEELLCGKEACELQRAAQVETVILIIVCIQFINHQERRNAVPFIYCYESRRIGYAFPKVFRVNETVSTFQNNPSRVLGQIQASLVAVRCFCILAGDSPVAQGIYLRRNQPLEVPGRDCILLVAIKKEQVCLLRVEDK